MFGQINMHRKLDILPGPARKAVEFIVSKPLQFARCFEDKLNAYHILIRSLACAGRLEEGISKTLSVLHKLGEDVPTVLNHEVFMREAFALNVLMDGLTSCDIMNLPVMKDSQKLVRSDDCIWLPDRYATL